METLAAMLKRYKEVTGKAVMLVIDTTFAPASRTMEKLKAVIRTMYAAPS